MIKNRQKRFWYEVTHGKGPKSLLAWEHLPVLKINCECHCDSLPDLLPAWHNHKWRTIVVVVCWECLIHSCCLVNPYEWISLECCSSVSSTETMWMSVCFLAFHQVHAWRAAEGEMFNQIRDHVSALIPSWSLIIRTHWTDVRLHNISKLRLKQNDLF